MTKLFKEIKNLDLEASTKVLTNIAHTDLVREYKQLADLADQKVSESVKIMAKEVALEVAKELLVSNKPETSPEERVKFVKFQQVKEPEVKELQNANSH